MLKGRLQWQLLAWLAGIAAVNVIASLLLFFLARPAPPSSAGRLLLLSAGISTVLIIGAGFGLWFVSRTLGRLSAGMDDLGRGEYPLLVAPRGNPLADYIRQFNRLS